jgi:hypothetical protein
MDVAGSCKTLTAVYQTIRCHVPIFRYILGVAVEMCLHANGTIELGG